MGIAVFNARFTPNNSSELSVGLYRVTGAIFDGNAQFSGFDVALEDVIFLDSIGSGSAPGTISRYEVTNIVSLGATNVTVDLTYSDTGSAIDVAELLFSPGFIARKNMFDFTFHTAPTIQNVPDYVIQYARSYDNYVNISTALSSVDSSSSVGTFTNPGPGTLTGATPVATNTSGNLVAVNVSSEDIATSFLGLTTSTILSSSQGGVVLSGLVKNISTALGVGDVLYVSKTGGLTTTAPDIGVDGFVAGDFVIRIGQITKNSTNPSNKDLLVAWQLMGQL
jgi:hypothetical protein